MNEIRKDYLLDRYVIVAENRGARPTDFIQDPCPLKEHGDCLFCPGQERHTPPETGRIGTKKKWSVRAFYNKFPAVAIEYPLARGSHEVVAETPEHGKQMADLKVEQIVRVLEMYSERTKRLEQIPWMRYVSIFKNQGVAAGTSILHSHSQLIALAELPPLIALELEASKNLKRKGKGCVFCDAVGKESGGPRAIFEDKHFLVLAPYASRAAFEVWFVPKRHAKDLSDLTTAEKKSLATMLKKTLQRLDALFKHPSFNYYLHAAPKGEDFHFHIELLPRVTVWAGFELSSGMYINPVSPEMAAKAYRGK